MNKINFTFFIVLLIQVALLPVCRSADIPEILSLKTQIATINDDTTQIRVLNTIAETYYHTDQLDSCLLYATLSWKLSDSLLQTENVKTSPGYQQKCLILLAYATRLTGLSHENESSLAALDSMKSAYEIMVNSGDQNGIATIHESLGWLYEYSNHNDLAFEHYQAAKSIYQETGNKKELGYLYTRIGISQRYSGNYGDAIESQIQALEIGKEVKDTLTIKEALLALAFTFAYVEKWEEALDYQGQALEVLTHWNDSSGIARVYSDIGLTYLSIGSHDAAIENHLAALKIRKNIGEDYSIASSYFYLGHIYHNLDRYEEALENFEQALYYSRKVGYSLNIIDNQLEIGLVYQKMGQEELAMKNLLEVIAYSEKYGSWMGAFIAYEAIADVYLKKGETSVAIIWLNKALAKAPPNAYNHLNDVYKKLADAFILQGDYKNGYENYQLHSQVKDSMLFYENSEKITLMISRLDYENRQALQNESHEKMIHLKQAEINRQKVVRNFSLFGMAFVLVMALIYYTRFVEKKKMNTQLNSTLSNLKSTQSQLIQSEKMASLGELTAGIAHEIQNPLNFVNNFSEVSEELLVDLKEELDKGDIEEVKAISEDIIENLIKIGHHGKRASFIVKGMLEHSRTGSNEKTPTDMNILAEEFLKLSYHGLRAKDKSFNANFKLDADYKLSKVKVVPQDIGRVLLNLINNAFYTVHQKSKQNIEGYTPEVIITTKWSYSHVEVYVKDNGNGIPLEVKDKIFQPFYTTKPTGEGTGLGLSLSYDIITKGHGGQLTLETSEGEGTTFLIQIPI